ncbi:DUF3592 domain-containing protein [Pseudomonas batumici]|uniref:DUF3592 domain-containing protein n=1 Tax=Pseudomonas batumici TaxID=226910 RepID=A0A0C2I2Q7_9PSED|nr:DUF3592 domain-containing protein [Pseudomonas batumici]KIH81225.1 hypothetical protein UCMB321_5021 [Pseudomonas batumici]
MYAPRETEQDYLFTRGVLLLFLIILAFGMAALSKSGGLLYAAIQAAPREVTGTITQVIATRKSASPADIQYAFDYEAGNRGQGTHSLNAMVANPTYRIGDPVQIVYSDWFPNFHSLKSEFSFKRADFYIFSASLSLIVLCVCLLCWNYRQMARFREEGVYY